MAARDVGSIGSTIRERSNQAVALNDAPANGGLKLACRAARLFHRPDRHPTARQNHCRTSEREV